MAMVPMTEQDKRNLAIEATKAFMSSKDEFKKVNSQDFLNIFLDTYDVALTTINQREQKKKEEFEKNPFGLTGKEFEEYNQRQKEINHLFK